MANINLSGTIHNESQSKVIGRRIALLEKYLGDLCDNFGKISRKNARLRDTGDTIASTILEYASKESINTSSTQGLKNYAQYLSSVEDYRNALVERIENKVIQPLTKYEEFLKICKNTIKSAIQVRDKEKQKQQKLSLVMQRQPDNGRNIAQAEADVEIAATRASQSDRTLREAIDKLEEKKLNDVKSYLKEYTHVQILFHAKAVEMLTEAYQCLLDIDTQSDLDEFRNAFSTENLRTFQGSKQSLNTTQNYESSLTATGGSLPVTPNRTRSAQLQKNPPRRARSNENLKQNDYSPNSSMSTSHRHHSAKSGRNSKLEIEDYSDSDSDN